ncbi:hypothetical protein [Flavobacterium facile]|uniref:hypothetical protein n=1 Tax=Flavobacterium facile TaxID=2893174 RepID=UPI002E78B929|nr:hypothetical protein [Flavobacterium sp. T-12]
MSYMTGSIFADAKVNFLADKLIYLLKEQFPPEDEKTPSIIDSKFGLTGKAALILQGTGNGNCNQVVFITNQQEIFDYISANLKSIFLPKKIAIFKERLLIELDYVKIEIWIKDVTLSWVVQYDVNIQESAKIPTELL